MLVTHPLKYALLLCGILTSAFGHAQFSLSGRVQDGDGKQVSFANVLLLHPADSALIRGALSGEAGDFQFASLPAGSYLVKATMVGFRDVVTGPYALSESQSAVDVGTLLLLEDAVLMQEVTVVAEKALFEQRVDRTIVNVAGVATSAGITALEVLERSPGIIVNRQSNSISMSGKEGVVVMINGRLNYMPMDAVFQLLSGMSSDNIERIELITTPPSKYDAEGNAGYINIVLKKNPSEGWSGSYNLSAGYGEGFRASGGLTASYVKNKWTLFGDYNYLFNEVDQIIAFYRRNRLGDDILETDTRNLREPERNNHNLRFGADYAISDRTVLSAQINGYDTRWEMEALNTSLFSRNGVLDTQVIVQMGELNHWQHLGAISDWITRSPVTWNSRWRPDT